MMMKTKTIESEKNATLEVLEEDVCLGHGFSAVP
jgi:hypothetical protein